MDDPTESIRRQRVAEISAQADIKTALQARHGQVWSTEELRTEFEVVGFMAPMVVVKRKSDGAMGSLEFQHLPRFYWGFVQD